MSVPATAPWLAMPSHAPAYSAVPARQSLMRPTPVPQQAPPQPPQQRVPWSDAVKDWVARAFENFDNTDGVSKPDIERKTKEVISEFAYKKILNDIDWDSYPLPHVLIQQERIAAAQAATVNGYRWTNSTQPSHPSSSYGFADNTPSSSSSPPSSSRKRKSMDGLHTEPAAAPIPPWEKTNRTFEERLSHGDKRLKKHDSYAGNNSKFSQADLERRRQRFQTNKACNQTAPPWGSPRLDLDEDRKGPVVGTNEELEKRYLRLTAPPKPETVRPQRVLEKTLYLLKKKWRDENNYNYICDQFKSLRQDLTVQHIKNSFTVDVYEIHARIALEKGDLGEYNQCQTQLRALYSQKLGGHPEEFLAYRILYYVYTCNKTDMNDLLQELTPADKLKTTIKHALDVRSALALGNYHRFFRLYLAAPNMGAYLMDMFIERERLHALANISRAYFSVELRLLTNELGFDTDSESLEFLKYHGAELLVQGTDESIRVNFKEARGLFEDLRRAAFKTVDIKGQV